MNVDCYIIPAELVADLTIKVDEYNEIRPIPINDGPEAGAFILGDEILARFPQLDKKLKDVKIQKKKLDTEKMFKKIATLQNSHAGNHSISSDKG